MANDSRSPIERFLVELGLDPAPLLKDVRAALTQSRTLIANGFKQIDTEIQNQIRQTTAQTANLVNKSAAALARATVNSLKAEREAILAVQDRVKQELIAATTKEERAKASVRLLGINQQLAQSELKIAQAVQNVAAAELKAAVATQSLADEQLLAAAGSTEQLEAYNKVAKAAEARAQAELKLAQAVRSVQQAQASQTSATQAVSSASAARSTPLDRLRGTIGGGLDKLDAATGGLVTQFGKLAGALGIIISLVDAVKALYEGLRQAAHANIDFQTSQYRLEIAIRANQRVMGEQAGTIADWKNKIVELRQQFKTFTTQDLNVGVANIIDLTRQFRLNQEQLEGLIESAAILAQRSGKTIEEAGGAIASFMQGEIGRALQSYGVEANEQLVNTKALELGFKRGADGFTQFALGQARLAIVMERTTPLMEDAAKSVDEFSGRLTVAENRINEANVQIGAVFAALPVFFREAWATIVEATATATTAIVDFIIKQMAMLVQLGAVFKETFENPFGGKGIEKGREAANKFYSEWQESLSLTRKGLDDVRQSIFDAQDAGEQFDLSGVALKTAREFEEANEALKEGTLELVEETLAASQEITDNAKKQVDEATANYNKELQEIEADGARDRLKAWDDYLDALDDLQRDFARDSIEAWEDYQDKLADIDAQGLEKRTDLYQNYLDKLNDLENDAADKRSEAWDDYQDKLEDIELKGSQKREDLQIDYNRKLSDLQRQKQIDDERAEEDHQQKLRDIRAKYNIDIDEAVQKRDARAILNLMRRRNEELNAEKTAYEKSKRRRQEDFEEKQRKAKEDYDRSLQDLEREEARQREAARKSYDKKLEDIEQNLAKQRDEALKHYNKSLEDLEREEAKQRAAAKRSYEEKLNDLRETLAERRAEEQRNYAQRLQDLDQALRQKRQKALESYRQELNDIAKSAQDQRAELQKSYRDRQTDLEQAYAKRLSSIATALAKEEGITAQSAYNILNILTQYYGAGGYLDQLIQDFVKRYQTDIEISLRITAGDRSYQYPQSSSSDGTKPAGRAQGGIDLITSPRLFEVGEHGQEIMITAPLANSSSINNATSNANSLDVNLNLNVTGRTDLFSVEFEERIAEFLTDAMLEARGKKR